MRLRSDSINMNNTEFTFIGLIRSNGERPYMGMNLSFVRFVKYVRLDSSLDELQRVFVTLFGLIETKRGTH